MTTRDALHQLLDALPDEFLPIAEQRLAAGERLGRSARTPTPSTSSYARSTARSLTSATIGCCRPGGLPPGRPASRCSSAAGSA